MSSQPIDYAALAAKFGAVSSEPAKVDYEALAKKFNGVSSQTLDPNQPGMQPKPSAFYSDLKGMITGAPEGIARMIPGPQQYFQYKDARADYESIKATGKTRAQLADQARQDAGYGLPYRALAPSAENVGVNVQGMEQAAREGDQAAVLGHAAAAATPYVAGAIGGEMLRTPQAVKAVQAVKDAIPSPKAVITGDALADRIQGPQASTMAEAAKLNPKVISGAEDVFRAAAPTGTNVGFRGNLYAAAGDLAEIARHTDIAESKGGIINPDMRVRATVDAINDHLKDMYEQERAPQIQRNANVPVKLPFSQDAAEGLQYLARRAGQAADRELAQTVMDARTPTVAQVDRLAQVANQELTGFEAMTPQERAAGTMINRRLASLKALDKTLGSSLNDALQTQGEGGIRAYERRFAALSEVRDQLQSRINATELDQPGVIKKFGRVAAGVVTGGKTAVASASQAATSDVNIGRSLQGGLQKLADSGISPERPKGTGIKPPPPSAPPQPRIAGLLEKAPTEMGAGPDQSGTPSGYVPPPVDATTRAQRLGLLLPEQTATPLPPSSAIDAPGRLLSAQPTVVRDPKTGRMKKMYLSSSVQ